MPRLSYYKEQNMMEQCDSLISKVTKIMLFFAIPCGIGVMILAEPIVLVMFGETFIPAIGTTKIATILIYVLGFSNLFDAYFGYKFGTLEYRSVRFETETLDKPNFQGNAVVNYTYRGTPWTRIIEHKWFEFGKDEEGNDLPKTVISREYSSEWKPGDEPYYPVNDEKNGNLYQKYKELADTDGKVIFGGRLGEYKYYDMDQVIAAALECVEKTFSD